ncbi:hypothetical protein [Actinoplanes sp. NPDC051494]|uniref:hypothetical protein n=1 Tax=Actinoplanes sp. NPDC051494 TaxID=3363907 RepID=UPI00378834EA
MARKGVPQSRQAHALLARGSAALEDLLSGFVDDMTAAGAATGDGQNDFRWYLDGRRSGCVTWVWRRCRRPSCAPTSGT